MELDERDSQKLLKISPSLPAEAFSRFVLVLTVHLHGRLPSGVRLLGWHRANEGACCLRGIPCGPWPLIGLRRRPGAIRSASLHGAFSSFLPGFRSRGFKLYWWHLTLDWWHLTLAPLPKKCKSFLYWACLGLMLLIWNTASLCSCPLFWQALWCSKLVGLEKTSLSLSCKLFSGQSTLEKGFQKMKWFGPLPIYIYTCMNTYTYIYICAS